MRNIAIIPARSGSKGLPDKNIKLLNGKPMIAYTIEAALQSNQFQEVMVSTDSEKYAEIAREYGASVPFLRSNENASDHSSSWDVVKEVLRNYETRDEYYDQVALLQPTSPLRTKEDILLGFETMRQKNADFVVSVCEMEHSPLWANVLPDDHSMKDFINNKFSELPRQDIPIYYRLNGAFYLIKANHLFSSNDLYNDKSYSFIMSRENSVDVDDLFDFKFAEMLLN